MFCNKYRLFYGDDGAAHNIYGTDLVALRLTW